MNHRINKKNNLFDSTVKFGPCHSKPQKVPCCFKIKVLTRMEFHIAGRVTDRPRRVATIVDKERNAVAAGG